MQKASPSFAHRSLDIARVFHGGFCYSIVVFQESSDNYKQKPIVVTRPKAQRIHVGIP